MFRVLDNGKPAKYPECGVNPSWNNCDFDSKYDALKYVHKWLGIMTPFTTDPSIELADSIKIPFELDYSGYGDIISIVMI